jgi:hypothetical protein
VVPAPTLALAGERAYLMRCTTAEKRLDEGDREDRDGEQDRDERFSIAGKIEVDHGVFRPFIVLDGTPPIKVYPSPICHRFARREIAPTRACRHPWFLQPDLEFVHFAIENLRREPKHVLAVQLLGNAGKRAGQLVRFLQQEKSAAGLLG